MSHGAPAAGYGGKRPTIIYESAESIEQKVHDVSYGCEMFLNRLQCLVCFVDFHRSLRFTGLSATQVAAMSMKMRSERGTVVSDSP